MHVISRRRLASYIADQLSSGGSITKLTNQVAAYLVATKQTKKVDTLVNDIELALLKKSGVSSIKVSSAHRLSKAQNDQIIQFIQEVTKAKEVIISDTTIDPSLIGGFTVETPEGYFDGSVRKKLQQLKSLRRS